MKSSRVAAIFREILPTILRTEYAQCNVKSTSWNTNNNSHCSQ